MLRAAYQDGQQLLDIHQRLLVDVDQFHGIEIEEFPAQIAQVALWLMDHQMNMLAGEEFGLYFARIPLKATPHIVHGNALRLDWEEVLPASQCSFMLGNPPFIGKQHQTPAQKADVAPIFAMVEGGGVLDMVAAWYVKAVLYLQANDGVEVGLVSTNSIVQGEQVGVLWSWLLARGVSIRFAHRTFRWSNEASGNAAVHCVVIGFCLRPSATRTLFEYDTVDGEPHALFAANINPYLVDAPDVLLPSRRTPICAVPPIVFGSMANDGGHLLLDDDERTALLAAEPQAGPWIRRFLGADEFINGLSRWCLWLVGCPPAVLRAMPNVMVRVQAVKRHREASARTATQALAATPSLFGETRQPVGRYLLVPRHSSERRDIIPIGFLEPSVIVGDANLCVPGATIFHFGVMTSRMHMAWVKYVCGRIKSDFRYTNQIVYNNFPWPESPTDKQQAAIEAAAQSVLDSRAQFPDATLADLYDPLTMPPALLKAHHRLDAAVDAAYGRKGFKSDAERVAFLFEQYQRRTSLLPAEPGKRARHAPIKPRPSAA